MKKNKHIYNPIYFLGLVVLSKCDFLCLKMAILKECEIEKVFDIFNKIPDLVNSEHIGRGQESIVSASLKHSD